MGSNHMHDQFRQTSDKKVIVPETDLDKFNRHLINIANNDVDIRHKILMVEKFIEALGRKED